MATNKENFDLMMGRLGGRSGSTTRTILINEVNKAIRELERGPTKPWFMEDRLEGVLVENQDYLPIPVTFLDEVEEGVFRLFNTTSNTWIPLKKLDYDQLQNKSENCPAAFPCFYALRGIKIFFAAKPDAAYAYRWECYTRTSAVSDTIADATNPWLLEFFDLVSLVALDKICRLHIRNDELVQGISQSLIDARDAYWRECEARQPVNRNFEQE